MSITQHATQAAFSASQFNTGQRFGINSNMPNQKWVTIRPDATDLYPWQSSAQELFIASDDADDAGDAIVSGVLADFTAHAVRTTISGQTPTTIGSFLNIHTGHALAPFAGTIRAGLAPFTMGVPDVTLLEIVHQIKPGGISKMLIFTVPKNSVLSISSFLFVGRADSEASFLVQHPDANGAWFETQHYVSSGTPIHATFPIPLAGTGIPLAPNAEWVPGLSQLVAGTKIEGVAKSSIGNDAIAGTVGGVLQKLPA
jgi:hypothetical protein